MIDILYEPFRRWSDGGSVYILSDLHLDDPDCKYMDRDWIKPEEQIKLINKVAKAGDTFVCLGDVGDKEYAARIRAGRKVLILGNHDRKTDYLDIFDEIYDGPLFISKKIVLSHEPIMLAEKQSGSEFCVNIHGHNHNWTGSDPYHLNLAANVYGWKPANLGALIKYGLVSGVRDIHRCAIDEAKNPGGIR